jgi:hypothetical protein
MNEILAVIIVCLANETISEDSDLNKEQAA